MNKVFVGLGNFEEKYYYTYHNAGLLAVRALAGDREFERQKQTECLVARAGNIIFAHPLISMNESGRAVKKLLAYTNTSLSDLMVLHDDTDITLGTYKIQTNRGSGGHHGIESIFHHVGTQNIDRVRIGVRPERFQNYPANAFVLKSIAKVDWPELEHTFAQIKEEFRDVV